MAGTDLHFLFSKGNAVHNVDPCCLVGFGILFIFGFKDGVIFGAIEAVSKQGMSSPILYNIYLVLRRFCRASR